MSHRSLGSLVLCLLLVAGCGDDDGAAPDAGPLPVEQCTNPADIAVIENVVASYDGGVLDGGPPDGGDYPPYYARLLGNEVEACSNEVCLGNILAEDMVDQCMSDCLATTPAAGLSTGCVGCQIEVLQCTIANCFVICQGTDMDACVTCAIDHCADRFTECTGLPNDTL